MDIKKLVKPNIRSLRAYQAEEIPCKIKLDANESPYGSTVLKSVKTNKYPDPEARVLRSLVAKDLNVKPENILHGNGSDELIYNLITTFGGPVLYPVPTFSMYGIIAQALGEKKTELPLDEEFAIDVGNIIREIRKRKPKIIFLSSPNNPTGNCFSSEKILKIIKQSRCLVVVDEAYQPFAGRNDFLPLLKKYKNLIILRTLSKTGHAGLRVGFMIADNEIVSEVNKVRLPFNLNSLSQKAAIDAVQNKKKMRVHIRSIISERKKLLREMGKMNNIIPYPSDANFILFKVSPYRNNSSDGGGNAEAIFKALLDHGILIRNMTGAVKDCLRVTVGTPKDNAAFIKTLRKVLP
jgi:histidinol-phosphate aminotransferase